MRSTKRRLEAVGYWFNELAPSSYPRPQQLVFAWRPGPKARVLAHLRSGAVFESYRAKSFCRFACGVPAVKMGHRDLTDGEWVWPEGLAHYVDVHSVRLPERFVKHAVAHPDASAAIVPADREGMIDEASWLAWGKARGASLDLAGWKVPDWAGQAALGAQIAQATRPGHPLWRQKLVVLLSRARPRKVVCRLRSGQLAIVKLRGDAPVQLLAGWQDWPGDLA